MSVNQAKVTAAFNDLKNLENDEHYVRPKSFPGFNETLNYINSGIANFAAHPDATLVRLIEEGGAVTKKIGGLSAEETQALAKLMVKDLSQLSGDEEAFTEAKSLYYGIVEYAGGKMESMPNKPDATHPHRLSVFDDKSQTTKTKYGTNADYLRYFLYGISPQSR